MTTPGELSAGWAVFGKPAGSPQDYAVTATSGWPLAAPNFEKVIRAFFPGDVPAAHGSPPNAFPWVTYTFLRLGSDLYRGMAITNWSGDMDRTGRPIAETFYCCTRARDDDPWPGFAATYRACQAERENWTAPGQPTGRPLRLPIPAEDPAGQLRALGQPSLERAVEAAAALLDRRQVVFPLGRSPLSLPDRLELLDGVRNLLPAGARHWLSAATWWDLGRRRGTDAVLCLSDRPGENGYLIGAGPYTALTSNARRYRDLLLQLTDSRGLDAVTAQLATGVDVQARDPVAALDLVRDLDLVGVVAQEIEAGEVNVAGLPRMIDAGLLDQLRPELRTRAIALALHSVEPAQLVQLRPFVDDEVAPVLVDAAQRRLWQDGWGSTQLRPFLDLAEGVHALDELLAALCRSRPAPRERAQAAARLLADRDPAGVGNQVRRLLASDPFLTLRVVMGSSESAIGEWLKIWHAQQRQQPPAEDERDWTAEAALRALAFASGLREQPAVANVAALGRLRGEEGVATFVSICRAGRPDETAHIVGALVLPWLDDHADGMTEPQIDWWLGVLEAQRTDVPEVEARSDLLRARWGRPRTDIADVVWPPRQGHRVWDPYAQELERLVTRLPPDRSRQVVDLWAGGLVPGWSYPRQRRDEVLCLLWRISHASDPNAPVSRDLLGRIVRELGSDGAWRRDPAIGSWRAELARHPELIIDLLETDLAQLPADTPVTVLAEQCAEVMRINGNPDRTAKLLAVTPFPGSEVGQLLTALVNRWRGDVGMVLRFIGRYVEIADSRSPGLRGRLVAEGLECLHAATSILIPAVHPASALTPQDRAYFLDCVRGAERDLAQIRAELESEGTRIWGLPLAKLFGANRREPEEHRGRS